MNALCLITPCVLAVTLLAQSLLLNQIWKDRERRRKEKMILFSLLDAKKAESPEFVAAVRQLLGEARLRATDIKTRK